MELITKSPSQTKKLGEILAKEVSKTISFKKAFVLNLEGDLGGGKTTFVKGFAKGLGIKENVLSPSFVLMRRFAIRNPRFKHFYHFDCYRIQKPKEILNLGFKKIISNPENLVAIEWGEKLKNFLPKKSLTIKFIFLDRSSRKIFLKNL